MNLTSERLERHGLYLIEDGQNMFLWVGMEAVPQLVMDVFGLNGYAELKGGKVSVRVFLVDPELGVITKRFLGPLSTRYHNSTTNSHSESMQLLERHGSSDGTLTGHIFTWSRRMLSLH
jgi:hypothetical protein